YYRLTRAHTAAYLAGKLIKCLHEYSIEDRLITCDNASSNTAMMPEIAKLLPNCRVPVGCILCFGHVLSLVVKVRITCTLV
ncbi:hypothetical protein L227DRAFT_514363, partial [Lentinus tigrinus ALCF2SS1-6]